MQPVSVPPLILALAFFLTTSTAASAQRVRVEVVERTGAGPRPVAGAIASLESAVDGARLSPTLSDRDGVAILTAPTAGRYTVRIDMVGRATWRSDPIDVGRGATVKVTATIQPAQTTLARVEVSAESQCNLANEQGGDVVAVWDEARKLLLASTLGGPAMPTLRVVRFERLVDSNGGVESSKTDTSEMRSGRPFATAVSAAELSELGYRIADADGDLFLAPDASVLLSEEFARDHCFSIVGSGEGQALVALAFRPQPRRKLVDVAGTFWLDRASGELKRIEFRYVNAGPLVERARSGGTVEFERIDGGRWIVASWMVRTPRLARMQTLRRGRVVSERDTVIGAKEEGASVSVMQGTLAPPVSVASVEPGRRSFDFTPQSRDTAVARRCATTAAGVSRTALAGTVTSDVGNTPVARANVRASWRIPSTRVSGRSFETTYDIESRESKSDDSGAWLLCDLPRDMQLDLTISAAGYRMFTRRLPASMSTRREESVQLQPCKPDDDERRCPLP
jgi:hypothetical protein